MKSAHLDVAVPVCGLPYAARTVPWTATVAGCATGIAVAVLAQQYAHTFQHASTMLMLLRLAFIPVVAASAFICADPLRDLTASLPTPSWMITAMRISSALPVIATTLAAEIALAAAGLATVGRTSGTPVVATSVWRLAIEYVCWCATAIAITTAAGRTRLHDLAGLIGAIGAIALGVALALSPQPSASTDGGKTQLVAMAPMASWIAAATLAVLICCISTSRRWHQLRRLSPRRPLLTGNRSRPRSS